MVVIRRRRSVIVSRGWCSLLFVVLAVKCTIVGVLDRWAWAVYNWIQESFVSHTILDELTNSFRLTANSSRRRSMLVFLFPVVLHQRREKSVQEQRFSA